MSLLLTREPMMGGALLNATVRPPGSFHHSRWQDFPRGEASSKERLQQLRGHLRGSPLPQGHRVLWSPLHHTAGPAGLLASRAAGSNRRNLNTSQSLQKQKQNKLH